MIKAVDIPVTVKCRIGVDDQDDQKSLDEFVDRVSDVGCNTFIVHARKAWLKGLSPKENRDVPPLDYDRVAAVKAKYPHLRIMLNGGIKTIEDIKAHLKIFDGVMIGREAYSNPYLLVDIEREIFGATETITREDAARAMINYIKIQEELYDTPIKSVTRHIIGLYHEQPGAKAWRRALSTLPHEKHARAELVEEALELRLESAKQSLINVA